MKFQMKWAGDVVEKIANVAAGGIANRAANFMVKRAKYHCPVRDGYLSGSIGKMEGGRPGSKMVVATKHYAAPVEFGHTMPNGGFVPPQPFLRLALEETIARWPDLARQGWVEATNVGGTYTGSAHGADLGGHD